MSTKDNKSQPGNDRLELFKTMLPKFPLILKTTLLHALGKSEAAQYLDLKSNLTIAVLRSMLDTPKPESIAKAQAMTLQDPGVKGRLWVSKVASQVPPEQGIRDTLLDIIDGLRDPAARGSPPSFKIPEITPVEAEWTGYRAAATEESTLPDISEEEKYHELMKECKNSSTILYFHGGAYYLCDPAMYRPMLKRLTKMSGGRAYSVRYRLAPQDPFPAALLDALVSYFYLLYPPPGSIHEAVAPGDIVFSGDSAGGNLSLALLQTILQFRRQNRRIAWFGEEREVPLPAGVAVISPWVDPMQTTPSVANNGKWCILPPPRLLAQDYQPPADDLWPTKPTRRHVYIDDAYLMHPLICLQFSESWEGSPPIYTNCGWERNYDENRYIVSKLTRDGVPLVFEEYHAMPHVFASLLPARPESRRSFEALTGFVKTVCENPGQIQSSYKLIKAKTLEEEDIDVDKLSQFSEEEMKDLARRMLASVDLPLAPPPTDVPAML